MGRPAKSIDGEMVRKLSKLGCTQEDIAEFFGCSHSVISERFRQDFHLGRAESRISIRRAQMKRALAGSDAMLIHLGKSVLGQTCKLDVTTTGKPTVVYIERANNPRDADLKDAELDGWTEQRMRRNRDRIAVCLPKEPTVEELEANAAAGTVLQIEDNGFRNGGATRAS
jgi:AraC-like DNA-binding protein